MFLCFCSATGPRASGTHFLKERAIYFSSELSGPLDDSATPCFLTLAHDPSCQQPRECGSGTQYLPTHLWSVPFGTQGVWRGCLRALLYHRALLPFAAPPQVCRLRRWSRLHSVWRPDSRRSACLACSHAQFDSATRLSSPGDLPSSTAFSRLRWQSGTHLSCMRRLLSS